MVTSRHGLAGAVEYNQRMSDEPSNGGDPSNDLTPFERFERLTKHLVSVPKSEVDARRKKAKAKRPTRKSAA